MLAADGKLFVVTQGRRHLLLRSWLDRAREHTKSRRCPCRVRTTPGRKRRGRSSAKAELQRGYAVLLGLKSGRLLEELVRVSDYHVIVVDPRRPEDRRPAATPPSIQRGSTASAWPLSPPTFRAWVSPPYLASLVVSEDSEAAGITSGDTSLPAMLRLLRPCGGLACFTTSDAEHGRLVERSREIDLAGARLSRDGPAHPALARWPRSPARPTTAVGKTTTNGFKLPWDCSGSATPSITTSFSTRPFHHETGRGLPTEIGVVDGLMKYATASGALRPQPAVARIPRLPSRLLEREKTYVESYTDVYTGRGRAAGRGQAVDFRGGRRMTRGTVPIFPQGKWDCPPPKPARSKRTKRWGQWPARTRSPGSSRPGSPLKTYGCDRDAVDYGHLMTYPFRNGRVLRQAAGERHDQPGRAPVGLPEQHDPGRRRADASFLDRKLHVQPTPSSPRWPWCPCPRSSSSGRPGATWRSRRRWSGWESISALRATGSRGEGTLWLDYPSVGGPSPNVSVRGGSGGAPVVLPPLAVDARWRRCGPG